MTIVSLVIPVFNEEENLPMLIGQLDKLADQIADHIHIEVLLVDDHSTDQTSELLKGACHERPAFHYLRLAANSGAHVAIIAGLEHARGDCAVFLAADLQDPPELIPRMVELWRAGHQIVWAVRNQREGISWADRMASSLFYRLLHRFGSVQLPPQGSDFALLDRVVIDALHASSGANLSLGLEIARLGFKQTQIPYVKAPRQSGKSKWSLERKLRAFADAFVATSYVPLRLMSYVGIAISIIGFLYGVFLIILRFFVQDPIEGWTTLMVVVLVFGGLQMIMLGVIGEYLWRTLEQARNRPAYFIEEVYSTHKVQPVSEDELSLKS